MASVMRSLFNPQNSPIILSSPSSSRAALTSSSVSRRTPSASNILANLAEPLIMATRPLIWATCTKAAAFSTASRSASSSKVHSTTCILRA